MRNKKMKIRNKLIILLIVAGIGLILYGTLAPQIRYNYNAYRVSRLQPMGLLLIDSDTLSDSTLSIKVPLYESTDSISRQDIVDVEQAAAIFMIADTLIIADHNYQEFSELSKVQTGTIAQIYSSKTNATAEYLCERVGDGYRKDGTLLSNENEHLIKKHKGKLIMYTCMENDSHIWYTVWTQIQ